MRFPYTNAYITNQFQTTFAPGVNSLVDVTVNSKEENSSDFCPNYVQEFGLWIELSILKCASELTKNFCDEGMPEGSTLDLPPYVLFLYGYKIYECLVTRN